MSSDIQTFLVNGTTPIVSNEFQVRAGAIRLFGANLGVPYNIEVRVGMPENDYAWVPAYLNSTQLQLTDTNNILPIIVSGQYRIVTSDSSPPAADAIVYFTESDTTDHDNRVMYVLQTPAPVGATGGGGGSVFTDNVTILGNGTSGDPLAVQVSSQSGNTLKVASDGLYNVIYSDSQTIAGYGVIANPLHVLVSSAASNTLAFDTDGLSTGKLIDVSDALALGSANITDSTVSISVAGTISVSIGNAYTDNSKIYYYVRILVTSDAIGDINIGLPETLAPYGSITVAPIFKFMSSSAYNNNTLAPIAIYNDDWISARIQGIGTGGSYTVSFSAIYSII